MSNQDLPDKYLTVLELQRAGYVLTRTSNKEDVVDFIKKQSQKGVKLPIDTINALEKELDNIQVLEIFLNMTKNKQMLNYDLLEKILLLLNNC